MAERIGLVGLGIMGSAYARHLTAAGFEVVGHDIDESRYAVVANSLFTRAGSPAEVARSVDRLILSLPNPAALAEVVAGPDGLVSAGRPVVVADTNTLTIRDKEAARTALEAAGITMLDCPVSGTGAQAAVRDLVIFASGDEPSFERMRPAFEAIGRLVHHLGPFGNGSKMKFVANLLVAIHNVSAAEAIAFGMKAGIDPQSVYDVIRSSAGTSRMFEVRGPMMVEGVYDRDISATVQLIQKDIAVIADHAREIDCPTPLFSVASDIHRAAAAEGYKLQDPGAVGAVLQRLAGVKRGG